MSLSPTFQLHLRNRHDTRVALYRPADSSLVWQDSGQPVSLTPVGMAHQKKIFSSWTPAAAVSPASPGRKTRAIRTLKIQLGLKCNYSCSYCNQGGENNIKQGRIDDVEKFLAGLSQWFDGGEDGRGRGVTVEFWGGEPLVYWKILEPLARRLREVYPNAKFQMISNLTLLNDQIIDALDELGVSVGMSHDGPAYKLVRGKDPLENDAVRPLIRKLFDRLNPQGRMGFNCVLTKYNHSLTTIRSYIAERLGVPAGQVTLTTEEIYLPYSEDTTYLSPKTDDEHREIVRNTFLEGLRGESFRVSMLKSKIESFYQSVAQGRPATTLGQKCGMDASDQIAVNLSGNVMTCQNTGDSGKHLLGNVREYEKVRLTTSTHWSHREECAKCPVLQMCQGACMYLHDGLWTQACDNSYTWNSAVLSLAMFYLTGRVLTHIEGETVRRPSLPSKAPVLIWSEAAADQWFPQTGGQTHGEMAVL